MSMKDSMEQFVKGKTPDQGKDTTGATPASPSFKSGTSIVKKVGTASVPGTGATTIPPKNLVKKLVSRKKSMIRKGVLK